MNGVVAFTACGMPAGRSTVWPVLAGTFLPPMISSTSPPRTCTMASKGAVCTVCPMAASVRRVMSSLLSDSSGHVVLAGGGKAHRG